MTPDTITQHAAKKFADGWTGSVSFEVPAHCSMRSFVQRVRELAKKRGYIWRVAYWGKGRTWLIKQKVKKIQ